MSHDPSNSSWVFTYVVEKFNLSCQSVVVLGLQGIDCAVLGVEQRPPVTTVHGKASCLVDEGRLKGALPQCYMRGCRGGRYG